MPRVRTAMAVAATAFSALLLTTLGVAAPGDHPIPGKPHAVHAKAAKTKPLRDVTPLPTRKRDEESKDADNTGPPNHRLAPGAAPGTSAAIQASAAAPSPPALATFPGISYATGGAGVPPDPNGEVGATQYVEMVNTSFAVYAKNGTLLYGPADISTLWQFSSGLCKTENDGDPIVLYDQVANRWLMSQFAFAINAFGDPVGPYYECVAVSSSADATGSWTVYSFPTSTHFMDDYPKLSVWPDPTNDMYVLTYNAYDDNTGLAWAGAGVIALNRQQMLAGGATSSLVWDPDVSSELGSMWSLMPSDFDGSTLPPAGSPATLASFDDDTWGYVQDQMELYTLSVDWGTSTGVIDTMPGTPLATAPFDSEVCPYYDSSCIPQPGVDAGNRLDALSDRSMFRAEYRNIGGYEHLLMNHTVAVGSGRAGVRWYDFRKPAGAATSYAIYQQSTFAPADTWSRWMASMSMDAIGDIAVGYSASGSGPTQYPGLRYAGRLWSDPLSTLGGEQVLFNGLGSQVWSYNRWGDYTDMTVDPVDGCTFYYVNEYYPSGMTSFNWSTRIAKIRFPACVIGAKSFTPAYGLPGTTVTLTGSGFAQGETTVSFGGTDAGTVVVASPTSLTAVVPVGAGSGPISVTSPTGTASTSASFSVTAGAPPVVRSFTPAAAAGLANVAINGAGLAGATEVDFGGVASPLIVSSTATRVVAQVPVDAVNGPVTVTTPSGTSAPTAALFTPLPKITSLVGGPALVGDTVTVNGYDFTANASPPVVLFGAVPVTPAAVSPTSFTFDVPDGVVNARVSVSNGNGTARSAVLGIAPRIDGVAPAHAVTGTVVSLTGATFRGLLWVKVGGVPASYRVVDYHHLSVTIPRSAVSGAIEVSNQGGTTSSAPFTVDPRIIGFSPVAAAVGAAVTVNGSGFGLAGDTRDATIGGVPVVTVTYVSRTAVKLVVPAGATTGTITISVNGGPGAVAANPFTVK